MKNGRIRSGPQRLDRAGPGSSAEAVKNDHRDSTERVLLPASNRESAVSRPLAQMQSQADSELKKLATQPGRRQYLAFDELARRVRDDPSTWSGQNGPWHGYPRPPNLIETEWAFLKWSQHLNDEENYALIREQDTRLEELDPHLDEDPGSLACEYFNAIGEELGRQTKKTLPVSI